jgi:hypothetical protein
LDHPFFGLPISHPIRRIPSILSNDTCASPVQQSPPIALIWGWQHSVYGKHNYTESHEDITEIFSFLCRIEKLNLFPQNIGC